MRWYDYFFATGRLIRRAARFLRASITDDQLKYAMQWARVAADQFASNRERREFVVGLLINRGVAENIARIIVEVAVGLVKAEKAEESK